MAVAKSELGPRPFEEFFLRGGRANGDVDDYLSFLMQYAVRTTCSQVGFLAIDESSGGQSHCKTSNAYIHRNLAGTGERRLQKPGAAVREAIKRCLRTPAPDIHQCVVSSTGLPSRLAHQEDIVELIVESASSAWIQLFDGQSPMGWLGLASPKQDAYSDGLLDELNWSLSQGMVPLNRLLLRAYAKKNGREIHLVGWSRGFLEFERKLKQAALHNRGPVLIRGERGSGKELAAYGIHYFSKRREGPFVSVLAPALAENLQADELFGHERNAFTGAARARKGKFLAAQGGTIFLDEVGDLSKALQFTLLRVVEHGEIQPVGRDLPISVDVRVVTATNLDPDRLVAEGRLRSDLFDRLNVIGLAVPPLRERREDIPLLVRYFLERECAEVSRMDGLDQRLICHSCGQGQVAACASSDFYDAMQEYDWPGNVRELENLMTRLSTMVRGEILRAHHLPDHIIRGSKSNGRRPPDDFFLETMIRKHIEKVLDLTGYNQVEAARMLGVPRTTLQAKMKKLNISCGAKSGSGSRVLRR
jgi:DNA-binding NtrC family response regulator